MDDSLSNYWCKDAYSKSLKQSAKSFKSLGKGESQELSAGFASSCILITVDLSALLP